MQSKNPHFCKRPLQAPPQNIILTVYHKPSFSKLEPFMQDIDAWLTEDKKVKGKQRHTACRIFNRLVEKYGQEFNCSYRTVASYVSIKREEVFVNKETGALPLEHTPGEAQLDFGEAEFYEKGKHHSGKYLNLHTATRAMRSCLKEKTRSASSRA